MSIEILAMDLSTPQAFVAWVLCSSDYTIQKSNIQIIQSEEGAGHKNMGQKSHIKHNEQLMPFIEKARASVDGSINNVKHIIVNTGPGSFTGLRISLALAKGIQSGLKECTIIGIDAMVFWHQYYLKKNGQNKGQNNGQNTGQNKGQNKGQKTPLLTVLDARSNRFYTALTVSSSVPAHQIHDKNAEDIITLLEHTLPPNSLVDINGFAEDMFYSQIESLNFSFVFKGAGIPPINMLAKYFVTLGLVYSKKGINILPNDAVPLYVRSPV